MLQKMASFTAKDGIFCIKGQEDMQERAYCSASKDLLIRIKELLQHLKRL